jgi:hypothetical protein
MNISKYIEWIEKDRIPFFERNSKINRVLHLGSQSLILILAALTPVFAALNEFTGFAVISGAALAILEGVTRLFRYKEIWVQHRKTSMSLKKEIRLYSTDFSYYKKSEDKDDLFIRRVEGIMDSEKASWHLSVVDKDLANSNEIEPVFNEGK